GLLSPSSSTQTAVPCFEKKQILHTPRPETPPQRARYPGHGTLAKPRLSNILLTSPTFGCIYTRESPRVSESHTTTDCEQARTREKKIHTHTHCANGNLSGLLSR
ncbi:unnamed protein product, partial [Ectocarpus sp. 8 AP-2014]